MMSQPITIEDARVRYEAGGGGHDFDHVLRVLALAERIAAAEGANLEVVRTAALLHDVAESEDRGAHHLLGAQRARALLAGSPAEFIEAVAHCIEAHRFRHDPPPQTLEAKVLSDADKLDSIGAIGVARAFAYGEAAGTALWRKPLAEIEREDIDACGEDRRNLGKTTRPPTSSSSSSTESPSGCTPTWPGRSQRNGGGSCASSLRDSTARQRERRKVAFPLPPANLRLETERLYLRPYRPEDAPWYAAMSLRNREHLRRFEDGNPAMTIESAEDAERVLAAFAADWQAGRAFFLGAFLRETDEFVAQIYVGVPNRDLPEFEIGFFADRQHEGRGYVSEAVRGILAFFFEELRARRVRLECDETNERSARVAERCGFKLEGRLRENHLWGDGSLTGTLLYGMLAREHQR